MTNPDRRGGTSLAVLGYTSTGVGVLAALGIVLGWLSVLPAAIAAVATGHVTRADTPPGGRGRGPALIGLLLGYVSGVVYAMLPLFGVAEDALQQLI